MYLVMVIIIKGTSAYIAKLERKMYKSKFVFFNMGLEIFLLELCTQNVSYIL